MKDHILSEIRRLASSNGGVAPGVRAFTTATGITQAKWNGVYWARWSDALNEAGYSANSLQGRRASADVLNEVAVLCRMLKKMPTTSDMKLHARSSPGFPSDKTVNSHFGTMSNLRAALRALARNEEFSDIAAFLPAESTASHSGPSSDQAIGTVYLLKSGNHFKIGRSDTLERRVREIGIAMPEKVILIHAIKTDDPAGIEAYWHKRFGSRRANGEWFNLRPEDVKAFVKRTFQ